MIYKSTPGTKTHTRTNFFSDTFGAVKIHLVLLFVSHLVPNVLEHPDSRHMIVDTLPRSGFYDGG